MTLEEIKETEVKKEVKKSKPKESTYPKDELMAKSEKIFGYKPEILAGAFHGTDKQEFTISEVKKLINKFLRKRV